MTDTVENLLLDLLEYASRHERTYVEMMEAWRTSCPRFPVWEEATDRGLVVIDYANEQPLVRVTFAGLLLLRQCGRRS